jgi:hypothetical protein
LGLFLNLFTINLKKDKLHQIIYNYQQQNDLRKQLLVIKNLADNYPNSGSLNKAATIKTNIQNWAYF